MAARLQSASGMRIRLLLLAVSLSIGCGAGYRHETLGSRRAQVDDRHASRISVAVPVTASGHVHRIAYQIDLPRALEVHYAIECPAGREQGVVGETWEAYRERRLAELERERAEQARLAGAVTGALLGSVGAGAKVETPAGQGEVTAQVDGQAAGQAVAEQALPPVQLSPADTGAQRITRTLEVAPGSGQCELSLWSERPEQDLSALTGSLTVTAVVDLDQEKRVRVDAARQGALAVRAEIGARLVAQGADPELRARLRAEAKLRVDLERQRQEEARARVRYEREQVALRLKLDRTERLRLEREARQRRIELALRVRGELWAHLIALGADPDLRARLEVEAKLRVAMERRRKEEARARVRYEREQAELRVRLARAEKLRLEREARQRRIGLALEVRGELWAYLIAHGADPELRARLQGEARLRAEAKLQLRAERARQAEEARLRAEAALMRRSRAALEARAGVMLWLTGNGAVVRPPQPEAPAETPTPSPSDSAVWVAGTFQWTGGQWVWSAGYWAEPPTAKAVWIAPAEVRIGGAVVVRPGGWVDGGSGKRVEVRSRTRRERE